MEGICLSTTQSLRIMVLLRDDTPLVSMLSDMKFLAFYESPHENASNNLLGH